MRSGHLLPCHLHSLASSEWSQTRQQEGFSSMCKGNLRRHNEWYGYLYVQRDSLHLPSAYPALFWYGLISSLWPLGFSGTAGLETENFFSGSDGKLSAVLCLVVQSSRSCEARCEELYRVMFWVCRAFR